MEKNSAVGLLVISFVAILIGVIGVSIISEGINGLTQKTLATEVLDLQPAIINYTWINHTAIPLSSHSTATGWRSELSECSVDALTTIKNYTGTAKTSPINYNFTAASGTTPAHIHIAVNAANEPAVGGNWTSAISNTTTVTYWYCEDDYIGGWQATIVDLVPGFFAIGIMIVSAFLIIWIMRKENIDVGI